MFMQWMMESFIVRSNEAKTGEVSIPIEKVAQITVTGIGRSTVR
jgi:hypothetical protein